VTRLSERLEAMLHARLTDEDSIIREAMELAKRYEDAPVATVERVTAAGLRWNGVDVTDYADYGQRVRILLDTEGV
jgi:hypothetical protein